MAYIGRQQDGFGVRSRFIYTATGGQTTFTTDDSSNALSYSDGAYVDVYLNGVLLDPSDYTATSLTSIVLDSGASADDVLEVIVYDIFSVFSGTFTNGITASEATVTGDLTVDTNTLYVDSTNNRVGVANASPATALDVTGTITGDGLTVDGDVLINSNSGTNPALITRLGNIDQSLQISVDDDSVIFKSEQDEVGRFGGYKFISRNAGTDTERLVIDLDGNVGIGTDSPVSTSKLDVRGRIQVGNSDDVSMASDARGHIRIQGNGYGAAITCDATGMHVYHNASGKSLVFGTNDTERGRFDGSGNLLVGRTGTSIGEEGILLNGEFGYLIQERNYSGSGNFVIYNQIGTGANNILFQYQGATKGSINWTSSSTNYNTSSDYRLKENIVDAPSSSSDIDAIQVRSFDWRADGSHQKYGMVAQELQSVAPEAVSAPEDPDEMMGVDYSKLVPMLVKEIQSLRKRIKDLEET